MSTAMILGLPALVLLVGPASDSSQRSIKSSAEILGDTSAFSSPSASGSRDCKKKRKRKTSCEGGQGGDGKMREIVWIRLQRRLRDEGWRRPRVETRSHWQLVLDLNKLQTILHTLPAVIRDGPEFWRIFHIIIAPRKRAKTAKMPVRTKVQWFNRSVKAKKRRQDHCWSLSSPHWVEIYLNTCTFSHFHCV